MEITDQEFRRIVTYVKSRYGIDLTQKRTLIVGRLENYLTRGNFDSYSAYMDIVEGNPQGKEAAELINALTTNHTYFMRESDQFDFLKSHVLPRLRTQCNSTKDIRIWCAASSTGEEPYTLEMILRDYFKLVEGEWDTSLLATDVSTKVLETAKRGRYHKDQLDNIPSVYRKCYFRKVSVEEYEVTQDIKSRVIFKQFNLMDPIPFRGKFNVVFLRNVMIYFDDITKQQLIRRIYDHMETGGFLFLGTTEALDRSRINFRYVRPSVYQKV